MEATEGRAKHPGMRAASAAALVAGSANAWDRRMPSPAGDSSREAAKPRRGTPNPRSETAAKRGRSPRRLHGKNRKRAARAGGADPRRDAEARRTRLVPPFRVPARVAAEVTRRIPSRRDVEDAQTPTRQMHGIRSRGHTPQRPTHSNPTRAKTESPTDSGRPQIGPGFHSSFCGRPESAGRGNGLWDASKLKGQWGHAGRTSSARAAPVQTWVSRNTRLRLR